MAQLLYSSPISRRLPGIALLFAALAACAPADNAAQDPSGTSSDDPPGAALPLSIGGRVAGEDGNAFEAAVNCAAALDITAERLMQMSTDPKSQEIRLMSRAQEFYKARAIEARQEQTESTTSPEAAIARRRGEQAENAAQQAQLAIACLRRFGSDAGAT